MKRKLLTLGVAILVAGSSAYAFGPMGPRSFCGNKMTHKSFMGNSGTIFDMMSIVSDMELSDKQWIEIKKTMLDIKEQRLDYLEDKNIQTRNLFAGNMLKQPMFEALKKDKDYRIIDDLNNTDKVMNDSFWLGVYPSMTKKKIEFILLSFKEFL